MLFDTKKTRYRKKNQNTNVFVMPSLTLSLTKYLGTFPVTYTRQAIMTEFIQEMLRSVKVLVVIQIKHSGEG